MKYLDRYWQTHQGKTSPLLQIYDDLQNQVSPLRSSEIKVLSEQVKLPEAAVRGIISYYKDLGRNRTSLRVCQGTSCMLAGADKLQRQLNEQLSCEDVYCLGYCDRSPAILDHAGAVFCGDRAKAWRADQAVEQAPPRQASVSSLIKPPIVTRRADADYSELNKARAAGAYHALFKALSKGPEQVLYEVERSGVRGRGGAGFPTGQKWRICANAQSKTRYVVVNGDEGDPGSFIDRVLMENDPHGILEGLLLCAYAIGAQHGIVFIRSEYPMALKKMRAAVASARSAGIFGAEGTLPLEISIFPGMGSYVCGEETALLSAIEGLRGDVQLRPPFPTESGLYGQPTVVNNVETLLNIPAILTMGGDHYRALGTAASAGTKAMCLNHGFARPGIIEVEFGTSLRSLIEEAGGSVDGRPLEAVILGGPMGSLLCPEEWDVQICYGAMAERSIQLGHGGLIAIPQGTDYRALLLHWLKFMKDESCGRCTPCRLGSEKAWQVALNLQDTQADQEQLIRLFDLMEEASLCAFGQYMPGPMRRMVELIFKKD